MPGPNPNFPDRWTNFLDMLDSMRIFTSTTSNHLDRFDLVPQSIGFICNATGDRWYCLVSDVADSLQVVKDGTNPEPALVARAQLVTSWMQDPAFPELMSFINYYG
jgi:hypothetical protein